MTVQGFSFLYLILNYCSESCKEPRCPVDNVPLGEGLLFPDNFAKREILGLHVHCPNKKEGCEVKVVLKQLQVTGRSTVVFSY